MSEAGVADGSEETQDFDPGEVNRFCHAHTLRPSNRGKPGRTLKGLTLCFSKNGDTFAAWKEKAYFDGKHTFLTNLLLVYPPYSLLLLTDFSFVVKGSYPAAYPSISTF